VALFRYNLSTDSCDCVIPPSTLSREAIDSVLCLSVMLCSVILHRFLAHVEVFIVFGSASVSLAADESIHAEHTHKAGGTGCFTSSC